MLAFAACSGNDSSKSAPKATDSTTTTSSPSSSSSSGTTEQSVVKGVTTPSASPSGIAGTAMGLGETDEDAPKQGFAGRWRWIGKDRLFILELEQKGSKITGRFATADAAENAVDKIDNAKPPTVTGTVRGRIATVSFTSTATNVKGRGKITLSKDGLDWKLLSQTDGELWVPEKAMLSRP